MGTSSRSTVALVALLAAVVLVGGQLGCVEDGWYYASGEPPPLAPPAGASPDCKIEVAPPSVGGAVDPRAPHAPGSARSMTPARELREGGAPNEIEAAAFRMAGCERNATE